MRATTRTRRVVEAPEILVLPNIQGRCVLLNRHSRSTGSGSQSELAAETAAWAVLFEERTGRRRRSTAA